MYNQSPKRLQLFPLHHRRRRVREDVRVARQLEEVLLGDQVRVAGYLADRQQIKRLARVVHEEAAAFVRVYALRLGQIWKKCIFASLLPYLCVSLRKDTSKIRKDTQRYSVAYFCVSLRIFA